MRKTLTFCFILIFLSANYSFAQDKPVVIKKSSLVETINGVAYYIHVVKSGHTIYAIARTYSVSVEDIYIANPETKNGISPEQIIKIPQKPKEKPKNKKTEITKEPGFLYHTVKKKETLYSIAKTYKVTVDDILKFNEDAKEGIQPDQMLKIPVEFKQFGEAVVIDAPVKTKTKDSVICHIIKRKETLYGLSKLYNVTQEQLEEWNPELKDGLKKGQIIDIHIISNVPVVDELHYASKTIEQEFTSCEDMKLKDIYNVSLMLPLYLYEVDDIDVETNIDIKMPKDFRSFDYIQFYEGAMMAVDSLKKQGFSTMFYVYDTRKDSTRTANIIKKNVFDNMDLIIGPLYYKNFKIVADYTKNHNTKAVNPFKSKINVVDGYDNVFNVICSNDIQYNHIGDFFIDSFPNSNIIIVHNENANDSILLNKLESSLRNVVQKRENNNIAIKVINYKKDGFAGLTKSLSKEKQNVILTLMKNEAFISSYLTMLDKIHEDYKIIIFGSSRWKNYSTVEIEYLNNLNLHIFSTSFVDYEDEDVKKFVRSFRLKYETEPNELAFQGFDITYYFLSALMKYGVDFENCLSELNIKSLQTNYNFKQNAKGNGFENCYLNIYKYGSTH